MTDVDQMFWEKKEIVVNSIKEFSCAFIEKHKGIDPATVKVKINENNGIEFFAYPASQREADLLKTIERLERQVHQLDSAIRCCEHAAIVEAPVHVSKEILSITQCFTTEHFLDRKVKH